MKLVALLIVAFQERAALARWRADHLANVTAAIRDALPIVERFRTKVFPESETVARVETAMRAAVDNASPMPGDEWSPTNPNPDAG